MAKPYKASAALEALILNMAPRHRPSRCAPDSFTKLKAWEAQSVPGEAMPVYDKGCDRTIYSHPRYNYAFRAWHDRVHLDINAGFGKLDEIKVCNEQIRQARQRSVMLGISEEDIRAITADVAGQVLYYYKYGDFVNDQALFVGACLEDGIFTTLDSEVRY
jgi:hypothetical protein